MSYLFSHMAPEIKAAPVPKIIARPYQTAAIEAAFREWETVSSTLIVLPTGTGKSVVFAKILKRWLENKEHYGRVMILAHRKELIAQAREHALSAGATCEIEMAGEYAKKADVVAASVQTLNAGRDCFTCDNVNSGDCHTCGGSGRVKRVTRFDPRDFGLIITDEGHHGTAASYMDVYTWFGSNPDNKRLFVTATPERADGEGLHNVCESVAYEMGLKAAIDEGWLCPIRQQFIEVDGLDLSRVSTRQGDLADGELQRAFIGENDIEQEKLLHAIAKPVLETAAGQQFIVFATGVEHATLLQAAFNAYDGAKVEMILGSTDPFERVEIVKRLRNGTTQGLVNVGVATEGFDCPAVAVVAIARPTKSTSLYMQMIGRGTRPLPGVVDGPETPEERRAAIAASAKKNCIAEGQLVLTDCGLVPIENITTAMKVWDGLEFVTHCGIIDRGEQRVITYAGLTATLDHEVWIDDKTSEPTLQKTRATFGWCAEQQIGIRVTGIGGQAIRETDCRFRGGDQGAAATEHSIHFNGVPVRESITERLLQLDSEQGGLSIMRRIVGASCMVTAENYDGSSAMRKPEMPFVQGLRSAGHTIQLCQQSRNGEMGHRESGIAERSVIRSHRQRRTLRTGKFAMGDGIIAIEQHEKAASECRSSCVCDSSPGNQIFPGSPEAAHSTGTELEANRGPIQGQGRDRALHGTARVFDIVNAGPRNRFTAQGLLVSNCTVMDFVGNSGNHKLVSVLDVLAGDDVDARDIAEAIRITKAQAEPEDMQEALEKAKQAREERERKAEEMRQAKQSTYNKADRVQMRAVDVDLFDGGGFDAFRDYTPEHHNDASVKQVAYLVKLGISPEKATTVSKRQAGAMIDKLTSKTGGEYIISFGKHKGNPINKIPAGWLSWAVQNLNSPEIVGHIKEFRSGGR